jgi:hypothetical protein
MNTQPLSDLLVEPSSDLFVEPLSGSEWYPSYEAGMAFCRVTKALGAEIGTKPEKEQRCLARMLDLHLGELCRGEAVKLVDLGTGDGEKMLLTIGKLRAAGAGAIRFVPVDTNPYITRYAILNILGAGKPAWSREEVEQLFGPIGDTLAGGSTTLALETLVQKAYPPAPDAEFTVAGTVTVPVSGIEIDFFQRLPDVVRISKRLGRGMSLFCLLGNTFGNYAAHQRDAFLSTMFTEIDPGDLFLLGIGLRPNNGPSHAEQVRMLEREYRPGEAFMRPAADHPESIYRLQFDPASHSMIHGFERPDGSMQHMGYSHLFAADETLDAIESTGFEIVAHETYPERSAAAPQYLTILARKPGTGSLP